MSNSTNPEIFTKDQKHKFSDLNENDLFNILKFIAYDKETSRSFASINKNTNEVYKNKIDIAKKENKEATYDPEDIHTGFADKVIVPEHLLPVYLFKFYNYDINGTVPFSQENINYFNKLQKQFINLEDDEIKKAIKDRNIIDDNKLVFDISQFEAVKNGDKDAVNNERFTKIIDICNAVNNRIKVKYSFKLYCHNKKHIDAYRKLNKANFEDDLELIRYSSNIFDNYSNLKKDELFLLATPRISLKYADKSLQQKKEFVLKAVKKNGLALEFASYELKKDPEIIKEAVSKNPNALNYANLSHIKSEDQQKIIDLAIEKGYKFNKNNIPENFKSIPYYAKKHIKQDTTALECYLLQGMNNETQKEVIDLAVSEKYTFKKGNIPENFKSVKPYVIEVVKQNGLDLQFASDKLKNDPEVIKEAVKQNTEAFFFADESLKKDKQFIKELINTTNNKDSNKRIIDYSTLSEIDKLNLKAINLIGERATKVLIFTAIITLIAIPIICTLIALGLNMDKIKEISKSVKNLEIQEKVANFTKSFG